MRSAALLAVALVATACTSSTGNDTVDPASTVPPSSTPDTSAVTTTEPPRGPLTVHAVGEIALDATAVPGIAGRPEEAFAEVAPLFAGDEITIGVLACPVDGAQPTAEGYCTTADLSAMEKAGFDVVVLAHAALRGASAVTTVDAVRRAGMVPVGAGSDVAQAATPALVEAEGRTVAVLAFSVLGDEDGFATVEQPGIADGRDPDVVLAAIERARTDADVVIVAMHWGNDQDPEPRQEDVDLARRMLEAGADAVLGHGAHRLHRFERSGERMVFLGLGHFVWWGDGSSPATAIARMVWPAQGVDACLLRAVIAEPGVPRLAEGQPAACPGEQA